MTSEATESNKWPLLSEEEKALAGQQLMDIPPVFVGLYVNARATQNDSGEWFKVDYVTTNRSEYLSDFVKCHKEILRTLDRAHFSSNAFSSQKLHDGELAELVSQAADYISKMTGIPWVPFGLQIETVRKKKKKDYMKGLSSLNKLLRPTYTWSSVMLTRYPRHVALKSDKVYGWDVGAMTKDVLQFSIPGQVSKLKTKITSRVTDWKQSFRQATDYQQTSSYQPL